MPAQSAVRNRLLKALSPEDFASLQPHLEPAEFALRDVLVEADEPVRHVCFLEGGLASVVATSPDEEKIEVGHVGWEGLTGNSVILGVERTPNQTFMQVGGNGFRVEVSALKGVMNASLPVRSLLLRYLHVFSVQLSHSALANGRYSMNERLARWLLMCHDRLDGDDLPLTHEFLSLMLGVRRSGVTNELHVIEGIGVIKATRGNIRVLDRARLEEMAGGCYGLPEREYDRLIGAAPGRP